MFKWLFQRRPDERRTSLRSDADLARERRNVGLWNNPVPDYSRVAPSPLLRNQARYLVANNAVAARAAQAFVDNVIGPGITLLPKIGDGALKRLLLKRWNRWTEVSDADGMLNWYGQQALAARSMFVDGEVFVRMLADSDAMLRLQLLPAEFIDTTITRDNVIAGIEFEGSRRSAYYIYEWHPGQPGRLPHSIRIPASEMLHIFRPKTPGQLRGVTEVMAILGRLNDLDQFDRATLVKQKTGALLTGFITTPNENPLGANRAEDGAWTASLEPGTIQRLSPGESMEFSDPPETAGYSDFAKTQLRLIASGLGLPYDVVTGDLSDTSYSSARVGRIELRKYIDALQWQFIHMLCRPVFQRWVELEILRGALPPVDGGVQEYLDNTSWAPPAMQMTDPQREVDAMVRAIRAGLISREMAVASLGYDLAEVDAQIAAGNAAADAAGIVLDSDPRKVTQQGNPATI
ncbi:MAG: phage portal protein [Bryobacteraceae bacterium]